MTHPYDGLDDRAYWRSGVAEAGPFGLAGLWTPKFRIRPKDVIATAGSCFAQHIGRALAERDYGWTDFEPAPPFLEGDRARDFNYGIFSFRTGNIYTPGMLLQWLRIAYGELPQPDEVWTRGDRLVDPLRPVIEPDGFADEAELFAAREATCAAVRNAVEQSNLFVFTLGLTENWVNTATDVEYALCPGTAGGTFDEKIHKFRNANTRQANRAMLAAIKFMRARNPRLKILLTVSPVPLTATASGHHVLTATQYSKSVLRAVAGMLAEEMDFVDYFPSYEIITHPVFRGMFYGPNMRSVVPEGVRTVMGHFFADQERVFGKPATGGSKKHKGRQQTEAGVRCEEELLDAFAK